MTQRLRIFFSATAVMLNAWTSPAFTVVAGTVEISSPAERNAKHVRDLSDIVVWLEPLTKTNLQPVQAAHTTMLQKNKMFQPHVLPVRVGTLVDFPNEDPIFHSAFSEFDGQRFDLALYPPGTTRTVRFRRPGIVRVFCNIHPSMSALILVLDTSYFTKVEPDGHYQFTEVPQGSYHLNVFDERATSRLAPALISIREGDERLQAPVIRVSEAGYLPTPHKNKYGRDYPPDAESDGYKGAPQ